MNDKPEILFLAHRIPFPPDKGDKIRSWRLLNYLCSRFRVHLACFVDDSADFAHEARLLEICETATMIALSRRSAPARCARGFLQGAPLTVAYYRDDRMAAAVDALRARPLAAEIVFSSTMAQYVETPIEGRPRLIDFCDADSEKFSDYAEDAPFPMSAIFAREGRKLGAVENDIANWADASFAITPEEAMRFNLRDSVVRDVGWWSNGVNTHFFDPAQNFTPIADPADIVFTGAMDYRANIDAAVFFVREAWPIIRAAIPAARLAIVGARPASAVRALEKSKGVQVTGRVDDVRPWLAGSKIAVAPLRVARGIQNKVLEAMAMGKPVIATTAAATGIAVKPGIEIVFADTPSAFAAAAIDLLKHQSRRSRIGEAARIRAIEDYQWDVQLSRFGAALDEAVSSDALVSIVESSAA